MKKIYRVERKTVGGNWQRVKTFNTKREAKSFAFHWVRDQKYWHRYSQHDRMYMELNAVVYAADDYGDCIGNEEFVCEYR